MLRITVSNERQRRQFTHTGGPLEFGRGPKCEHERFIVEDRFVSRNQLRVRELSLHQVRVENLGGPLNLADGTTMQRGDSLDLNLPVRVTAGYTMIEVAGEGPDPAMAEALHTISRPLHSMAAATPSPAISSLGASPSADRLAQWFETLLTVQRAAAGSGEFYHETARAVVQLVGLDRGLVLLRDKMNWVTVASHATGELEGSQFSSRILNQVVNEKRTFFEGLSEEKWSQSLVGVESVVASPIFDERHEVLGVVYGSRSLRTRGARRGIQPLEAQVVQLLAGAVSAGLVRLQKEAEAARTRVQFEQFCSPKLARALELNPQLLEGHEREVSVMFCDVRRFSDISQRLGTSKSYDLLADAMDLLTRQFIDHDGIVIDYYGDGVAAMWNAPEDQPDHPALACRAALDMLDAIPQINEKWADVVGEPLALGIGVNVGIAKVGNAGSRQRMKYGPHGHTVNLASRVEGTTKMFHVPVIVTAATRDRLPATFVTRRICQVRVVNIPDPVTLYELKGESADDDWLAICNQYEEALSTYESGRWDDARRILETLSQHPQAGADFPCRFLLQHASTYCTEPPKDFDPVFPLTTK